MDCQKFQQWIYHFQADEIPEADRREFERHLDGCPDCARLLEFEDGLLRTIKAKLPRAAAPPGLETRVRAALCLEAPAPASSPWYRTPWFAATAAALLLMVLVIPGLSPLRSLSGGSAGRWISVVAQEVEVVDLDCDRAGMSPEYQRRCRHPHHFNALKTGDGRYWHISPDQADYGKVIRDPEMRGQHLIVDGDYYPAINTLRIQASRPSVRDIL